MLNELVTYGKKIGFSCLILTSTVVSDNIKDEISEWSYLQKDESLDKISSSNQRSKIIVILVPIINDSY